MNRQGMQPSVDVRPHVVMLVDNGVVGDSRVQKQATSIAAKGWRVTLVGKAGKGQPDPDLDLPGVDLTLVEVTPRVGYRAYLERRPTFRAPTAYRNIRVGAARSGRAEAAVLSAAELIDTRKVRGTDTGLRRLTGRGRMAVARARRRWTGRRQRATMDVRNARLMSTGRPDVLAIHWWKLTMGQRAWSRLDPAVWDWEMAFGPVVDELRPDVIHANDHQMLAIGARATNRLRVAGQHTQLVWDVHEWVAGADRPNHSRRAKAAQVLLEQTYAHHADAVVTVSDTLAEMLRAEFDLPAQPTVVVNAPLSSGIVAPDADVREVIGLGPEIPLLLYSGVITPARSVDTIVRALPRLPGVHFVMVVLNDTQPAVTKLLDLADELGVRDRMHLAPFVPVEQIVPYLAGADVGVHSLLHGPNNEIALATKYYEYAQARLPIVVTDVKVMAETTRRLGLGEVWTAGDPADLARAVSLVLADKNTYRRAYDDEDLMRSWTWEAQADTLDALYRSLLA